MFVNIIFIIGDGLCGIIMMTGTRNETNETKRYIDNTLGIAHHNGRDVQFPPDNTTTMG